jgi:transposase
LEAALVRVTTAFNRILRLPGANVESVSFTADGIVVGLRARSARLCCPCGEWTRARYDTSQRRWRHLDMGATKVWLEAEVARVDCRACAKVRTQLVGWARPRARHSTDFEDTVAWLVQRTDMTTVASLMRCSWEAVQAIAARVTAEKLDTARLDGLVRIGVDEISYRRGHQYLTIVADHDRARVVWVAKGKRGAALESFFDELGPERASAIEAISMDLGTIYRDAAKRRIPAATICFDPFHVIQIANRALDSVYKSTGRDHATGVGDRAWRQMRFALRSAGENLTGDQHELLKSLRRDRYRLWRAWELKEALRGLYRLSDPADARLYLKRWITSALRSRIPAFVNLARQVRRNYEQIISAVELDLSNARLEGINSRIRLIQRRGYGYRSVDSLAAMIYLCIGGVTVTLPHDQPRVSNRSDAGASLPTCPPPRPGAGVKAGPQGRPAGTRSGLDAGRRGVAPRNPRPKTISSTNASTRLSHPQKP